MTDGSAHAALLRNSSPRNSVRPIPAIDTAWLPPPTVGTLYGAAYGWMIAELRAFLDAVAEAKPDKQTVMALATELSNWKERLDGSQVTEDGRVFGRYLELPGRGQTMCPAVHIRSGDNNTVDAAVKLGPYFLGADSAAHGGAVPLLFDELLGRLANAGGRRVSRTAYLRVDYRSVTPIDVELQASAWFVSEDGRKRIVRGELRDGDRLCAEAEGLFVELPLPTDP